VVLRLSKAAAASEPRETDGRSGDLRVSFVNNMPDAAFDHTEQQFLSLLETGAGKEVIEVRRHSMRGVARDEPTMAKIAERYSSMDTLIADPPDILVITGSNPVEEDIANEPYWREMVEVLSWAKDHVGSILLSCLSAHAALKVFDGIEREQLEIKRTGVFSQDVVQDHPLTQGIGKEILLPHSRKNGVRSELLEDAGYQLLIQSDEVGWSVATKDFGGASVVLVQGHPEYEPSSLLREYRRDAGRYVRRERDDLPVLPFHCVAAEDWDELERLHQAIIAGPRIPTMLDSYPFDEVGSRAPWSWRTPANSFYSNWLRRVAASID